MGYIGVITHLLLQPLILTSLEISKRGSFNATHFSGGSNLMQMYVDFEGFREKHVHCLGFMCIYIYINI